MGSNVAGIGASGADRNPVGVALIIAGYFGMLLIAGWNRWIVAGRTGQSWGRRMLRIRLLGAQSGRPVGFPLAFGRDVTHLLDSFCLVGYLWPLWDSRRQTFADKVCGTVVVPQPVVPPTVGDSDPST